MAKINQNFYVMVDLEKGEDNQVYALGTEEGELSIEKDLDDHYKKVSEEDFLKFSKMAIACANNHSPIASDFYEEDDEEDLECTMELSVGNDSYEVCLQLDRETLDDYPDDLLQLFMGLRQLYENS